MVAYTNTFRFNPGIIVEEPAKGLTVTYLAVEPAHGTVQKTTLLLLTTMVQSLILVAAYATCAE